MNKKGEYMKIRNVLLLSAVMITIFSCPTTKTEDPATTSNDGDNNTVSYKTVKFKTDGEGYSQFYTDDPSNADMTFWYSGNISQSTGTYDVAIDVKKVTGNQNTGFGLIFCVQPSGVGNFLMVQLSLLSKEYMVGKVVGQITQTPLIQDWTPCASIKSNLNDINRIEVKYNAGTSKFDLYINNTYVCNFLDKETVSGTTTIPAYTSGKWGYIAEVSSLDDLPYVPVDVRFKQITP
jgi:hypothetical protein